MPEHGGDTTPVLRDWLGMDDGEIEDLRTKGVIK